MPSTRVTTTPFDAPAASSAARPLASWPRSALISSCSDLISSSRRCTPPTSSSVVDPTRRAASATSFSSRCSSRTEFSPVTASMRRRLEPIDDSLTILIETDVAGGAHVGAAAQLDRVADLEDPDDVAVLVAEEGDRAERRRLRPSSSRTPEPARWRAPRCWRSVRSRAISRVGDGVVVAEVESQPVGRDERAGLLDVLAQHLAQRVVQHVGAGVIATNRGATLRRRWLPSRACRQSVCRW